MKLKKINAVLGLLSILLMLLHIGYSVFAYFTMYYNPVLKYVFAVPFMVMACLHAICGMMTVFTQGDGTRMDLYPNQNMRTVLQRLSAALIFPLLILHLYTFTLMNNSATSGKIIYVILLIIAEVLFFATVITHVSVSITKAFITLGILSSKELMDKIDKVIYIVNAVVFVIAVVVIVRGQIIMFLS